MQKAKTTIEVLKEWLFGHVTHLNIHEADKPILEEKSENKFVFKKGNVLVHYFLFKQLDAIEIEQKTKSAAIMTASEKIFVVLPNTKKNLNLLLDAWDKLALIKSLTLYFVNPYSLKEKYWAVVPAVHNRITRKRSRAKGLKAVFSTVEPYVEIR